MAGADWLRWCPACEDWSSDGTCRIDEMAERRGDTISDSPRGALSWSVQTLARYLACPSTHPEKDRVEGGQGSQRAERIGDAALVMMHAARCCRGPAELDVLCSWAVGCTAVRDSPYGWAWCAEQVGLSVVRTHHMVGGITSKLYRRLRSRGIVGTV
jgi:hypothetical protein